jgi:hypothetical protein
MVVEIVSELFSTPEFPAITKFGSKLILAGYTPEEVNECIGDLPPFEKPDEMRV